MFTKQLLANKRLPFALILNIARMDIESSKCTVSPERGCMEVSLEICSYSHTITTCPWKKEISFFELLPLFHFSGTEFACSVCQTEKNMLE